MDDKRETLERWLFAIDEPPFGESYEELAEHYEANLRELHEAEAEAEWTVNDLLATPHEIEEAITDRLAWLAQQPAKKREER